MRLDNSEKGSKWLRRGQNRQRATLPGQTRRNSPVAAACGRDIRGPDHASVAVTLSNFAPFDLHEIRIYDGNFGTLVWQFGNLNKLRLLCHSRYALCTLCQQQYS